MKKHTTRESGINIFGIRNILLYFVFALMATSIAKSGETYVLDLRSNEGFVVLAGSTVTGTTNTSITGDVGLSPAAGSYVTGIDGTNVTGSLYVTDASGPAGSVIDATLLQTAKSDLTISYNDAAGRTPVPTGTFLNPNGGNIGSLNLVPGLYKFTSSCLITGSDVTLTGDASDVWIFQIASNLVLGDYIKVILAGGAKAANIFWQVGTSATLGTYSVFKGTILADQSVSLDVGASLEGRALAFSAAVTMNDGVTGTEPVSTWPLFSADSSQIRFGNVVVNNSKTDTMTVTNTGTADLIIDSVNSSNSLFTIIPNGSNNTITSGSTKQYYVTFEPTTNGIKNGKIYFYHNADDLIDSMDVSGTGISPMFSVNPTTLDFGDVGNNMTKIDSVTVTNNGTSDLIISSITSSNSVFTITPLNGTIAPGESKKYYVTFAPLVDGVQNANIVFNYNGTSSTITATGTGVSPLFSVNPTSLDFGNVRNDLTKEESVTVTNNGSSDLIISSITSSNSLFTVIPLNGTITPGSSMDFDVTFAPLVDGVQNANIVFNHNGSSSSNTITATGTGVSPLFSVNPTSLDFGNVRNDLTKEESVTVTNTGTADLIINSVTSSNSLFTVTPLNGTITPGSSMDFDITFAPLVDGLQNANIVFNHNAKIPVNTVTVSGTGVSPLFSVNPTTLDFGNVRNDLTKEESVTVTNNGTSDLIISSITSSNSLFTVIPLNGTITPGSSMDFDVTFAPLVDGVQNANIVFNHNANSSSNTITATGTGVSPLFSVNPSALYFGNVRNDLSKDEFVMVTNNGTADLIINSVTSSNSLFTITPLNVTITPGSSMEFYVTFAPLVDGLQNANIVFNHNANSSSNTITATGTGVSPLFSVNPTSLNFGNVRNDLTKEESVTVTNNGTSDLLINSITSSNSVFTVTPLNGTITPGSSMVFDITFAPLVDGLQNANIVFNHNAKIPVNTVTVSGTGVSPLFSVNPTTLDFGNVRNDLTKEESVTVTNTGTADLIINSVTSSNSLFTVTPLNGTITPGSSMDFDITFAPLVDGLQNANIVFNHNAKIPVNTVTVSGTGVSPLFTVNPTTLDFGNVRNDLTKEESVTVTNTGTADLIINSVTSSNSLFTVTPLNGTITPGSSMVFDITFAPLVDGLQNANIVFNHNAKIPVNTVTVSGTGVSPLFSVNPTTLDFGNVRNDLTKTNSVTVTNNGTADLIINSITSSNSVFTITPYNGTITPGSSMEFYVTFAPLVDGFQNANIVFNHNAKIPVNTITVSGTGISPLFTVNPTSLDFGNVKNNFTRTNSVTVTNTGTADLIINSVTSSNSVFTVTPFNVTITPGSSMEYYITFAPLVDGFQNANIVFNHNAKIPVNTVTVSGTGVSPKFSSDYSGRELEFYGVPLGSSRKKMITVTNTGDADLVISKITSTNKLFTITPLLGIITPGSSMEFDIIFSPIVDGYQTGYINFNHDATNKKDVIFATGYGISPKFTVNPTKLNFGNVSNSTTKIESVTVTNTGTAELTITNVSSSNYHFSVMDYSVAIMPNSSQKFYITFTPLTSELHDGYIYFKSNVTNQIDSIYVSGTGIGDPVSPVFAVNPSSLDFGSVNSGTTKSKIVTITNIGNANLVINSTSISNIYYSTTPNNAIIQPGKSVEVSVTFSPLIPGHQNGYVYFYHNSTNGKDSIQISGIGIGYDKAPELEVISSLDFGNVFINKTKQLTIEAKNIGTADLIISDIISSDLHYIVTPIIGTLTPNTTKEFYITFAPTYAGPLNANIIFIHNAGRDTVKVTGMAIDEYPVITIKEARELPFGTEFTIEGVVTRALGRYTRIQDASAAITIFETFGLFFDDVENNEIQMTDKVRVQGSISEQDFLKVISGSDLTLYQRISRSNPLPKATEVTLSEIVQNGEQYESQLITLNNLTVTSGGDATFHELTTYKVTDDTDMSSSVLIGIGMSTDTYLNGMPFIGEEVIFEGVLSQSGSVDPLKGYQLTPILPTDLRTLVSVNDNFTKNSTTLYGNYPNPFSNTTTIRYNIPNAGFVSLIVYDMLGIEIAKLVDKYQEAGLHSVVFSSLDNNQLLSNKVYYYRLEVGAFGATKQMILLK